MLAARRRLREDAPARTPRRDELLTRAVERLPLSGRGRARVARVAATIAALAGAASRSSAEHLAEALSYRPPVELTRMSELATAVFAARSGSHLLDAPRSARFAAFLRGFDEAVVPASTSRGAAFAGCREASPAFPARLRAIHDPPPGLFVRGEAPLRLLEQPSVAVVGARACSAYGAAVAASLGRELAAAGVVVVSGLARGIDGGAHRGALEAAA